MEETLGADARGPLRRGAPHAARGRRSCAPTARAEAALALNDVVVNRGARRHDDRLRGRDRRPLRLRDARGRHHRRHAHRLDRLRAVGAAARSSIRRCPRSLLVPVAPHALTHRPIAVADTATIAHHARCAAAMPRCTATARRTSRWPKATASPSRRAPHAARFLHPEGHDHFAMLREKLHWSETPERLRP